jgi:ATP-dependent RNA helicase DHX8/PRP22
MVVSHRVFVLVGETGSGKTTQIPQFLFEAGLTDRAIAITQPRRVAAISVAHRVAFEMGVPIGGLVGYSVRFEDCSSSETMIRFVTDGRLLREAVGDRNLSSYGIIVLDEAHERTLQTDVLFGFLKEILMRRDDLRIIIMSATLSQQKFAEFWGNCPVLTIPGRTFPIQTSFAAEPVADYIQAVVDTVLRLHQTEPCPGDILVFLTGQDDIDIVCEMLRGVRNLIVLPMYASLPIEKQARVFDPPRSGFRKVVCATNVAETSLTIDGIRMVVDSGFVKEMWYDSGSGMDNLRVVPVSRASADQRRGRAGRTAPGKCVRLYTQMSFESEMAVAAVPEIQRSNIVSAALRLRAMGIPDLVKFDFMDKPPVAAIVDALQQLFALGALDREGRVTLGGLNMAAFPLDPQMSRSIMEAVELRCSEEVLIIAGMLSAQNVWVRPKEAQSRADRIKEEFNRPEGDHLTLLHVYQEFQKAEDREGWCRQHFVHFGAMKRAEDVIWQLRGLMDQRRWPVVSAGGDVESVMRAIAAGYFARAARKKKGSRYETLVDGSTVHMFPGSALFSRPPEFVIYHEIVNTTKEFMRNVMAVKPKWLLESGPGFYRPVERDEIVGTVRRW